MIELTITCPNCSAEIKRTESLAASLFQATSQEYYAKITEKEAHVSKREAVLRDQDVLDILGIAQ